MLQTDCSVIKWRSLIEHHTIKRQNASWSNRWSTLCFPQRVFPSRPSPQFNYVCSFSKVTLKSEHAAVSQSKIYVRFLYLIMCCANPCPDLLMFPINMITNQSFDLVSKFSSSDHYRQYFVCFFKVTLMWRPQQSSSSREWLPTK